MACRIAGEKDSQIRVEIIKKNNCKYFYDFSQQLKIVNSIRKVNRFELAIEIIIIINKCLNIFER